MKRSVLYGIIAALVLVVIVLAALVLSPSQGDGQSAAPAQQAFEGLADDAAGVIAARR